MSLVTHSLANLAACMDAMISMPFASIKEVNFTSPSLVTLFAHLDAWDLVSTGEILCIRRAAFSGRAHSVLVVFTNEDDWKIPKLRLAMCQSTPAQECVGLTMLYASNT